MKHNTRFQSAYINRSRSLGSALLLLVLLLIYSASVLADVQARVDRSSLKLGETITLVLETNDTQQTLDIDTDLLSADFHLLDTRNESMVNIVNGVQTATVRILYVLEPKHEGVLVIPAFKLAGASTQAIAIKVDPAPTVASGEPPVVFMEVETGSDTLYVGSQLALTVRLYYRYSLTEGNLPDPKIDNATLVKLGETAMSASRNGVNYRALERIYAVFPERSGELIIPEISFLGRVNEPSARRGSLFTPMSRGRRVRAASEAKTIEVKPRPASFPAGATWLPARQLLVKADLKRPKDGVRVGEPLTRTIELKAVGLLDTMFPDIDWPVMKNARVYPDTPESVSRNMGQWVTGQKTYSYAVVPEQSGDLLLPEISIPWWDTIENKLKVALVPAEKIEVLPALGGDASTVISPPDVVPDTATGHIPANEAVTGSFADKVAVKEKPGTRMNSEAAGWWRILAITGFALWILTLLFWWLNRKTPAVLSPHPPADEGLTAFRQACRQNQPLQAARSLRQYAYKELSINDGLSGLANRCKRDGFTELAEQIENLNRLGYAAESENMANNWDGRAFGGLFTDWLKQNKAGTKQSSHAELPPFYPAS